VYEEEFGCRDGFRWSNTGKYIAFWQPDASSTGTYDMMSNTDSVYSKVISVQYPKVGQPPSACKVGIIDVSDKNIIWIPVPGNYDVARYYAATDKYAYFNASPKNNTQRYLYRVSLTGKGDTVRITPMSYAGVNLYAMSPNGNYAIHRYTNIHSPSTVNLVNIPDHQSIKI